VARPRIVRKADGLEIIRVAFARLDASGHPETEADNSDQGGKSKNLSKPYGHQVSSMYAK
jgi:hypothetical protein